MGYSRAEWGLPVPYHTEHRPRRGELGFVADVVGGIKLGFALGCEVSRALSALTTDRGGQTRFWTCRARPPPGAARGLALPQLAALSGRTGQRRPRQRARAVPLNRRRPRNQKKKEKSASSAQTNRVHNASGTRR